MRINITPVNYNELHRRFTYVVVTMHENGRSYMTYALAVFRKKENQQQTPYVCFYAGLNSAEYAAFRTNGWADQFSFCGIPNDTIDVSHDVSSVMLHDKPIAYVGVDMEVQDEFEINRALTRFVEQVSKLRNEIQCAIGQSSSSSKTLSESLTHIKAY